MASTPAPPSVSRRLSLAAAPRRSTGSSHLASLQNVNGASVKHAPSQTMTAQQVCALFQEWSGSVPRNSLLEIPDANYAIYKDSDGKYGIFTNRDGKGTPSAPAWAKVTSFYRIYWDERWYLQYTGSQVNEAINSSATASPTARPPVSEYHLTGTSDTLPRSSGKRPTAQIEKKGLAKHMPRPLGTPSDKEKEQRTDDEVESKPTEGVGTTKHGQEGVALPVQLVQPVVLQTAPVQRSVKEESEVVEERARIVVEGVCQKAERERQKAAQLREQAQQCTEAEHNADIGAEVAHIPNLCDENHNEKDGKSRATQPRKAPLLIPDDGDTKMAPLPEQTRPLPRPTTGKYKALESVDEDQGWPQSRPVKGKVSCRNQIWTLVLMRPLSAMSAGSQK
jgi:hypothetical protein